MAMQGRTALVLGATGGIGGEVTRALVRHGWHVRALTRDPRAASRRGLPVSEWIGGDAMHEADVVQAARGAGLIFHGVNPLRYQNWRGLAMPMLAHAIAAARTSGARLLYPGNVYNYGADAWPLLSEDSPQHPHTRKGAIRVEMEAMLREAAQGGVRSLVLRAGDFFGPHAPASWLGALMVKPGQPVRRVLYPGDPTIGHAWAYLPDLGEAFARLADIEARLPAAESLHFAGHFLPQGIELVHAIGRAVGNPKVRVRPFRWSAVMLAAPFSGFLRELLEMRYLWRQPLRLDNARLRAVIGEEPRTALDDAMRHTLQAFGCLESSKVPSAAI